MDFPYKRTAKLIKYKKNVVNSDTIYLRNAGTHIVNLSSNATLYVKDPEEGGIYRILITQDSTGGRTVTWNFYNKAGYADSTIIKWRNQQTPVLSISSGITDIVTLVYCNGYYYGQLADNF